MIDRHVSLTFVREKLQDSYSETGITSIDPELLLRILLIGYGKLTGLVTGSRLIVGDLISFMHSLNGVELSNEYKLTFLVFACRIKFGMPTSRNVTS